MPSDNFTQVRIRKTTLAVLREQARKERRSMANQLDVLIVGKEQTDPPKPLPNQVKLEEMIGE